MKNSIFKFNFKFNFLCCLLLAARDTYVVPRADALDFLKSTDCCKRPFQRRCRSCHTTTAQYFLAERSVDNRVFDSSDVFGNERLSFGVNLGKHARKRDFYACASGSCHSLWPIVPDDCLSCLDVLIQRHDVGELIDRREV